MKKMYHCVQFRKDISLSEKLIAEKNLFERTCLQRNIPVVGAENYDKDWNEDEMLKIDYDGSCWILCGKKSHQLDNQDEDILLVPKLYTNKVSESCYGHQLATWEQKASKILKSGKDELDQLFRKSFHSLSGIDECYEWLTGGVIFYDYEWFLIHDDPIKDTMQKKDEEGSTRYLLNLDDKVLLRGPDIYYFFSCYISRYKKPTYDQACVWFSNCDCFLADIISALDGYEIKDDISKRLVLSILDNVRNIILLMSNSEGLLEMDGQSSCIEIDTEMIWNNKIDSYQDIIWNTVNNECIEDVPNQTLLLCRWVKEQLQIMRMRLSAIKDPFILAKCFNPLREVDNYFENYIVINEIAKTLATQSLLNLIGVIYGGIELPYILRRIRKKKDIIFLVFQNNGMYLDRQCKSPQYSYGNLFVKAGLNRLRMGPNILIDDNIMSGMTLQLILNDFASLNIYVDKCAVIRHPCINRIAQSIHNQMAVEMSQLNQFIIGALSPTPYSKIRKGTNYADMFTDELYIFSVMTEVFLKGLYKNNSFIKDSEVDIFRGFSEGHRNPTLPTCDYRSESYYNEIIKANNYIPASDKRSLEVLDTLFGAFPHSVVSLFNLEELPKVDNTCVITGFGLNGAPHLGTLNVMRHAIELQRRGYYVQVILGNLDVHNTRNVQWEQIKTLTTHYSDFLKSIGFIDDGKSGHITSQYDNFENMRQAFMVSSSVSDADFTELEEDVFKLYQREKVYSGLTFSVKQAMLLQLADFTAPLMNQFERVIVLSGIDEHPFVKKANDVYFRQFKKDNAISGLFIKVVPGINNYPKMSKSISGSSISLDMPISEIQLLHDKISHGLSEQQKRDFMRVFYTFMHGNDGFSFDDAVNYIAQKLNYCIKKWQGDDE